MKNSLKFDYPNVLQNIFDKLDKKKIKSIIIGGFVRDFFLNIESTDIDIELYGVTSFKELEAILEEFGSIKSVGKSFGVYKLSLKDLEIDFTLPRIDSKISSGHRGFKIHIDENLDFKTATSRRDFTINAIGYDTQDKIILDPFNGQNDLNAKILRAVDVKKFVEDPLRVLRAIQFASRFNLTLDKQLFSLCKDMCDKNILKELAKERILEELKKLLLKSKKPSYGFKILKEINGLKYLTPLHELDENRFNEVLSALDNFVKLKTDSKEIYTFLSLAILCHKFNAIQTAQFIKNLTDEKILLKDILTFNGIIFKDKYSDSQLFKLAVDVNIELFLIYKESLDSNIEKIVFSDLKNRAKELNILNKKASPLLQGRDILALGIKPSKEYKKILEDAYQAQMDLKIKTTSQADKWLKDYLRA